MTAAEFWQVDIMLCGKWQSTPHSMRSRREAQNRADAVFHWATARVTNVVTREAWSRKAGCGWALQPVEELKPPPSNPRSPMRAPENAAAPPPDVWYRKGDME